MAIGGQQQPTNATPAPDRCALQRTDHGQGQQQQSRQQRGQETKAREAESLGNGKLSGRKTCAVNRGQKGEVGALQRLPDHYFGGRRLENVDSFACHRAILKQPSQALAAFCPG